MRSRKLIINLLVVDEVRKLRHDIKHLIALTYLDIYPKSAASSLAGSLRNVGFWRSMKIDHETLDATAPRPSQNDDGFNIDLDTFCIITSPFSRFDKSPVHLSMQNCF